MTAAKIVYILRPKMKNIYEDGQLTKGSAEDFHRGFTKKLSNGAVSMLEGELMKRRGKNKKKGPYYLEYSKEHNSFCIFKETTGLESELIKSRFSTKQDARKWFQEYKEQKSNREYLD